MLHWVAIHLDWQLEYLLGRVLHDGLPCKPPVPNAVLVQPNHRNAVPHCIKLFCEVVLNRAVVMPALKVLRAIYLHNQYWQVIAYYGDIIGHTKALCRCAVIKCKAVYNRVSTELSNAPLADHPLSLPSTVTVR
jgi:hypothetical protein